MDAGASVDPEPPGREPGTVDTGDTSRFATEAELAVELRRAVATGELTAYYQPQYDLPSGEIVAVEALCRWHHPRYGLLLPASFIGVAEHHGLIASIGRFMLEESGRRASDWHRRGVNLGLSINVSASELGTGFAHTLLRRVSELELPHHTLTLEITESPELSHSRTELSALETLIDGGVGVSIDDFGAGYTSIDLVRHLPLTEVKIDKSLVHDRRRATDDLVRRCAEVARERGAVLVAEGVETQEHFDRAAHWGCERAQGYFFAPPMSVEEVEPLLLGAA
jgi:EAL domain-containing protein (putative c-di-GMP-specific phosphodiesterase class I)